MDNKEKKFSEYLDKLLNGEQAEPGSHESDELQEDLDFALKLMELRSEPAPAFKSDLEKRLAARLVQREQPRAARQWWQFEPSLRWVSLAATAAVVILAIVGFLGYRSLFYQAPASTTPSAPAVPTAPGKITTPSATSLPTAPTTPVTPTTPAAPIVPAPPPQAERPQQEPSSGGPPLKYGGSAQVSWAYYFENLSDLTAFSDAVVVATVTKVGPTVDEGRGAYSTQFSLNVENVLKGPPQLSQLSLRQMGSPIVAGSDSSDDPLFQVGERYLFFLREYAPGQYATFGPQSRYLVWNNRVYSMNYVLSGGGGYRPPTELSFFGVSLDEMSREITKIVNSVQLIFTRAIPELNADVLRYPAGTTLQIDARLSGGEHGPSGVTLTIDKLGLPAGLNVSIQPAAFVAYPRSVYASSITITMAPDLKPGTYYIPVDYNFGDSFIGRRTITLHAEAP